METPLEVFKQLLCVLSIRRTTCSDGDAAVTRVSMGAGVRKALRGVGRCERMSNSGSGGGRFQGFELTRNLPGRVEPEVADQHCATAPVLLCLGLNYSPRHMVCEPGTQSGCLVLQRPSFVRCRRLSFCVLAQAVHFSLSAKTKLPYRNERRSVVSSGHAELQVTQLNLF